MKAFYVFFFFLFAVSVQSQVDDRTQILEDNREMIRAIGKKNYEAVLDYTYPPIFTIVDRQTMKQAFVQIFEGNSDAKLEFMNGDDTPVEVSPIYEAKDKTKYAFVVYPFELKMITTTSFDKNQQNMMVEAFRQQGMDAQFANGTTILIKKLSLSIALNNKETKGKWKYVNHDDTNPMYPKLIDREILSKAKEYNRSMVSKQ